MSKLDKLQILLDSRGLWAKKSLGQNFLVDQDALDKIVNAADLHDANNVIEIGPGTGFLTEQLIQKAGQVLAVELDEDMVGILQEQFPMTDNLKIIHANILDVKIEDLKFKNDDSYKVVANIPYYITSPVIRHFLQAKIRPELMVILIQKEVAQKMCSMTGRSFITVETEIQGNAEYIATIPASSFYPVPKVDSAILKITIFPTPLVPDSELKEFLKIVKFGFSQKRKKLSNSLGAGLHKKPSEVRELMKEAGIDTELRAEDLSIDNWKNLAELLN